MPFDTLPANWADNGGPQFHADDQNTLEQVVNEHSDALDAAYTKPVGGIPEADLAAGVQGKLGKIGTIAVTGTPAVGQVPIATSASAAAWGAVTEGGLVVGQDDGALLPETYGAAGNGSTDDTTAMQSWLTAVTAGNTTGRLTAGKVYRITAALTISTQARCWHIQGQGSTIRQATNNTAILSFTVGEINAFSITDILFDYTNQQTSTGGSAAVVFDQPDGQNGWFGAEFRNITFSGKCYRGFQSNEAHNNPLWGSRFVNIRGDYGMTGTVIRLRPNVGAPNNAFEHVWQNRDASNEPVINVLLQQGLRIVNLEVNQSTLGGDAVKIDYSPSVSIDTARFETGTNNTGDALFRIDNCPGMVAENWAVQALTYPNPGSVFKLTNNSTISVGPGTITTYSPFAAPGANLSVVSMDSSSRCTRFEGVARPSAVADFAGGAVTGGQVALGGPFGATILSSYNVGGGTSTSTTAGGLGRQAIMTMGDSVSAAVSSYDAAAGVDSHAGAGGGHSPFDWLFLGNLLAGSPLDVLGSAATAGYTVEQIRDIHLPTVLAAKPQFCVCWTMGGNNLLPSGEFDATTVLRVSESIIAQLVAAGIRPVLATIIPPDSGSTGLTQSEVARYNSWAANIADKNGYPLLDFYGALVEGNPASGQFGKYKSGYTTDGLHPNAVGTAAMAPLVRDLITRLANTVGRHTLAHYQGGTGSEFVWQYANPLLVRTGGVANTPDGWSSLNATVTLAASTVAGNKWTLAANSGSTALGFGPTLAGVAGDEWDLALRLTTAPAAGGGWGIAFQNQASSFVHAIGSTSFPNPTVVDGKILHLRGKFPSGSTSLQLVPYAMVSGSSISLEQVTFRNLSAMSI